MSRARRAARRRTFRPAASWRRRRATSSACKTEPRQILGRASRAASSRCRPPPPRLRRARVARSCRRARRKDRPRACRRRRRRAVPAATRRRPAPTRRLRQNLEAARCGPSAGDARFPLAARGRPAARPSAPARSSRVRSSGGSIRFASAIACARVSPQKLTQRVPQPVRRVDARRIEARRDSRRPRSPPCRSTALTSLS